MPELITDLPPVPPDLLAIQGYFHCEKQACTMKETACIARQKNANGSRVIMLGKGRQRPGQYDYQCKKCPQGRAIAKRHRVTIKTRKTLCKNGCGVAAEIRGLCKQCYSKMMNDKRRGKAGSQQV